MLERFVAWLYARLGSHYWMVMVGGQAGASLFVVWLTIGLISVYYDNSWREVVLIAGVGSVLTVLAVGKAGWKARSTYDDVVAWRDGDRSAESTLVAWESATTMTFRQFRGNLWWVNLVVVVPTILLAVRVQDMPWTGVFVMLLAVLAPAAYASFLSYSTGEALSRPLIAEIAAELPDDFPFERRGLQLGARVAFGLPTYTVVTGLLVAAIVGERNGSPDLVIAVLVAVATGAALSFELAMLLGRAITEPLEDVRSAMRSVRGGDLTARVPVMTSDDLGELAHDFNTMARGLQEREEMRTAFGTYVDKAVVEVILSGQFPPEGLEIDVSVLFCDVRGFTAYSEEHTAPEVVSALNHLFELIVPIVDRHGGHVDKFIGDGMLAVFGAPRFFVDHADRAVRAACEIAAAVRDADAGLTVAAGINSGLVVAGSVGGAGRLNFSVIGDVVNVAARTEAATRQTGDDVLVTAETRARLSDVEGFVSRGTIPLKGKAQPVELFAPTAGDRAPV